MLSRYYRPQPPLAGYVDSFWSDSWGVRGVVAAPLGEYERRER